MKILKAIKIRIKKHFRGFVGNEILVLFLDNLIWSIKNKTPKVSFLNADMRAALKNSKIPPRPSLIPDGRITEHQQIMKAIIKFKKTYVYKDKKYV